MEDGGDSGRSWCGSDGTEKEDTEAADLKVRLPCPCHG